MGKILIILGGTLIIVGLLLQYGGRIPFLGRLPGDIVIDRPNFKMYVPITTSILLSIILSLVFYFINRSKQ